MNSKLHSPEFAFSPEAALSASPAPPDLGALPEWRLQDLYEAWIRPRFAADLERAEQEAKLSPKPIAASSRTCRPAGRRRDAGRSGQGYEALQDLIGRIMSYASLLYAGDTSNPPSQNSTATRRKK